jgi:hypothetical protein
MPQTINLGVSTYDLTVSGYDTIPALRSQPMADSPNWSRRALAVTFGNAAAMDGAFGFFAWDPTSVAADDGQTVIKPDSITGPGRWRLIAGAGGSSASGVLSSGGNYCFAGAFGSQVLKLLNVDTALHNQINSSGIDGEQTVLLQDGSVC